MARRRVLTGVLEHLREDGRSALLVSHSLVDIERAADRVALLVDGRVTLCDELEAVQTRAVRVLARLADSGADWTPPGEALMEGEGSERVLFYLDGGEAALAALDADPRVVEVERLGRDLEDVVAAAAQQGRERAA